MGCRRLCLQFKKTDRNRQISNTGKRWVWTQGGSWVFCLFAGDIGAERGVKQNIYFLTMALVCLFGFKRQSFARSPKPSSSGSEGVKWTSFL